MVISVKKCVINLFVSQSLVFYFRIDLGLKALADKDLMQIL